MNKSFFIIAASIVLLLSASIFWAITRSNSNNQQALKSRPTNPHRSQSLLLKVQHKYLQIHREF